MCLKESKLVVIMAAEQKEYDEDIQEVKTALLSAIKGGEIDSKDAISIVRKTMELVQRYPHLSGDNKKHVTVEVIRAIAAGKDGIAGTEDDLILRDTVNSISVLLEGNLIHNLIDVIKGAAKGEFDFDKIQEVAVDGAEVVKGCWPYIKKLFKCCKCKCKCTCCCCKSKNNVAVPAEPVTNRQ